MNQGQPKVQPVAQAGSPGKATGIGLEVGGVHSSAELRFGYQDYLKLAGRDAACPHAQQRSKGVGNGSQEIIIPEKLRKLRRALYRTAKSKTYECFAMKRLGKPDTGNPSVRFDEGSEPGTEN